MLHKAYPTPCRHTAFHFEVEMSRFCACFKMIVLSMQDHLQSMPPRVHHKCRTWPLHIARAATMGHHGLKAGSTHPFLHPKLSIMIFWETTILMEFLSHCWFKMAHLQVFFDF